MDKILLGIAASTHPEAVKKVLFTKMIAAASKPLEEEEVTTILQLSSQWVVGEEVFLQEMGLQVFQAWAKYNPIVYEDFFCHRFLISALGESISSPLPLISFISACLPTLQHKRETAVKIVRMRVISLCRGFPAISVQGALSRLLLENRDCLPDGSFAATLCQALITNVAALAIPMDEGGELKTCMKAVGSVGNLLKAVWSSQVSTIIPSLKHVFNIISTVPAVDEESESSSSEGPSLALGALVQHIPMHVVEVVTKSAVSDVSISDERMTLAMQRMIDWLSWPSIINIDRLIITFLTNLASVHKLTILIKVILLTVETMLYRLCFPVARDSAFVVFSHMLLSFQHAPDAFHKIIGQVPELVQRLKKEGSTSSQSCVPKLAELIYTLMYHHAGYPELYEPILEALKDFPRPSEAAMVARLKQRAWTAQNGGLGSDFSSRFAPRSETGKTGLVNLGNTCYMNSVIQALFMTPGFCDDIVSYPLFNRQSIMFHLQHCFAFLAHTQRAAYAPREFLKASRPSWFAPGSQQDCSEFLKYLLDRLDEEEKGWRKMMSKVAATLTTSLSSPSSSSSSPTPSSSEGTEADASAFSHDQDHHKKDAMEVDTSTQESEEMACQSSTSSALGCSLSESDSFDPSGHLPDEGTSATAPSDTASGCGSGLVNQPGQQDAQENPSSTSWSSGKMRKEELSKFRESIVERYFGGKSATHIRCLNCGTVSSRKETFFDLPLAFPGMEGSENLLGGHSDTPAEERHSEKSEYATIDLPQDNRSVVGASAIASTVGATADHHGSSRLGDAQGVAGSSLETDASTRTSLEDLLKHYFSPEFLVKENRYRCDKCQSLQDAEKTLEIVDAPQILIVTLLRFSYDIQLQQRCKIMEDVRYPRVLQLDVNSCPGDCSVGGHHKEPCTKRTRQNSVGSAHCSTEGDASRTVPYLLSALIVHSGRSSESGHYYCYACDDIEDFPSHIKSKQKSKERIPHEDVTEQKCEMVEEEDLPSRWFLFNDSRVTESKFDSFGKVTQRFPRDTAYVLFYRKCDTDSNSDIKNAVLKGSPSSSTSQSSSVKEKRLRKDLQDAIQKDNLQYMQERELEARKASQRSQRPPSAAAPFFSRHFDDKNDPPGGCGLGGGGGGGGGGGLGFTGSRLVF